MFEFRLRAFLDGASIGIQFAFCSTTSTSFFLLLLFLFLVLLLVEALRRSHAVRWVPWVAVLVLGDIRPQGACDKRQSARGIRGVSMQAA